MLIWVDLANSPQVLFFRPIIAELHQRGHKTIITSRHFAQTIPLANRFGMEHTPVGGHAGERGFLASIWVNFQRARQQLKILTDQPIDLAVSHNAYAQAIAAGIRRLPFVTAMDYEHQRGNHLPFRVAQLVIVPAVFPDEYLRRYGARRVFKYDGVKEQIYLADFVPDEAYRAEIGLPEDKIIVTIRPPSTWALYHRGVENHLVTTLLQDLGTRLDVRVVFLPRVPSQQEMVEAMNLPSVWIPGTALDGPNLICASDIVISAGGTMNREAAVLGLPAYTIFAGALGEVDQYLIDQGRLTVLQDASQLKVDRRPRREVHLQKSGTALVKQVTDAMLSVAQNRIP
jgi:predicted glycosyltransferase